MKRLALFLVAICAVALPTVGLATPTYTTTKSNVKTNSVAVVQGLDGKLRCTADGKSCTQAQVNALAATFNAGVNPCNGAGGGPAHSDQGCLALAKDGTTLLCGTAPCTAAHLPGLQAAAKKNTGGSIKS